MSRSGVRGWYRAVVADLDAIRTRDPSVLSRGEALLQALVIRDVPGRSRVLAPVAAARRPVSPAHRTDRIDTARMDTTVRTAERPGASATPGRS